MNILLILRWFRQMTATVINCSFVTGSQDQRGALHANGMQLCAWRNAVAQRGPGAKRQVITQRRAVTRSAAWARIPAERTALGWALSAGGREALAWARSAGLGAKRWRVRSAK
jgi:hypothetical protein